MKDIDPRTDAELLLATGQDVDAFGVFYRRHSGWVLGFVARRVRDPELAADVTSEVFAAALLGANRLDESLGAPNSWLFGIVTRQIYGWAQNSSYGRAAKRFLAQADRGVSPHRN